MHTSCFPSLLAAAAAAITLLLLVASATAAPSPAHVGPRCGTTYYPSIQQQLAEATPDTVGPNTAASAHTGGAFVVRQTVDDAASGSLSDRVYELVAFDNIPAGSTGCQLAVTFPGDGTMSAWTAGGTAAPQLSVTTVLRDRPDEIVYPNNFTFSNYATLSPGGGLFGMATVVAGTTAVVNTEACDARLAFVFRIASWTGQSAGVGFSAQPPLGVYLTANC